MSIISVKNLNFQETLENISFTVEKGDFIGLAGPNGAGKTTLIKLILGLFKADQGEIKILNTNIAQFKDWDKVGYLPQKREQLNRIFPATVFEVVATGLTENKNKDKKVNEALKLLRISDLKQRNFFAISGGQQQRVLLARSIVCDPEIIFLDEPSNALDPKTRDEFFETLNYLNKEKGKTVILITHDTGAVGQYAQKLLYLDKSIVYYGNFKNFCENQEMGKYFGTSAQHLICHQH